MTKTTWTLNPAPARTRSASAPQYAPYTLWQWLLPLAVLALALPALAADLPLLPVQGAAQEATRSWDGQVQAERQAQIAAEVPGRITALRARAGAYVQAGQVLLELDASSSRQHAEASRAQVATAQAALDVATTELARKRQLADKKYISQAALEQAQAQHKAARAQVAALQAQARAARTQEGLHTVRAPWDGVVARLAVELGDVAQPGQPLLVLYDPAALRVSAHVPVGALAGELADGAQLWLPGTAGPVAAAGVRVMPTVDPASLTQEVRALLPAGTVATPGQFARLQLPTAAAGDGAAERIFIPASSIVRRAEVTAVYVATEGGTPLLRQLRLGPAVGDQVEVLAGLDAGEHIVTDPQAAARALAQARAKGGKR